jgi:hypothetical protein
MRYEPLRSEVPEPPLSLSYSSSGDLELRFPGPFDWTGIGRVMESRYYKNWKHDTADIIRVVRHVPTMDVVGVVTIKPYGRDYLADTFEVEWIDGRATRRGARAALLVEEFYKTFQKATGRKLYCLVMDDNGRHESIIKKRGWKHVANLLEFNEQA